MNGMAADLALHHYDASSLQPISSPSHWHRDGRDDFQVELESPGPAFKFPSPPGLASLPRPTSNFNSELGVGSWSPGIRAPLTIEICTNLILVTECGPGSLLDSRAYQCPSLVHGRRLILMAHESRRRCIVTLAHFSSVRRTPGRPERHRGTFTT